MKRKELFAPEPKQLIYRDYEEGPLAPDRVRVTVEHAAPKHGTEFVLFRGVDPFLENSFDENGLKVFSPLTEGEKKPFGMRPGNIWIGLVSEVGADVTDFKIGDRVWGYGPLRPTQDVGVGNCRLLPEHMSWKEAVCYDPAQFALGGIRDGHVRMGDNVAVFALGAIGQIAAQMAKLSGAAKVIVIDPIEKRRAVALENDADLALDPTACDAGLEIKRATNGRGADVVIETSGEYTGLQAAIRGVAYAGNIAVVGWYKKCKDWFHLGMEAHFNQPNIFFSRACSDPNRDYPRWSFERICEASWAMLEAGMLKCDNLIDPIVPFDQAGEMYMSIERDASHSVKMGVDF